MSKESVHIENLEALKNWVSKFCKTWSDRQIILLEGDMGVGKTQFVIETLNTMGYSEASSPSFAIMNCYETDEMQIDHVDLYRLESDEDLESTGFWDLFLKPKGLIFIEWASRLPKDVYPRNWNCLQVEIKKLTENQREIIISN